MILTDALWRKMEPHCLGKKTDPGRSGQDNRLFVEAVLWKVRTNSPWRDLPEAFGKWRSIVTRFKYWSIRGVFDRMFAAVADDPDMQFALVDSTIVSVDPDGSRAKRGLRIKRPENPELLGRL